MRYKQFELINRGVRLSDYNKSRKRLRLKEIFDDGTVLIEYNGNEERVLINDVIIWVVDYNTCYVTNIQLLKKWRGWL